MRTDQSLADCQTGIGAAADVTQDMQQLISCTTAALVDTIVFYKVLME